MTGYRLSLHFYILTEFHIVSYLFLGVLWSNRNTSNWNT